jgi:hypothetical protein
MFIASRNYRVTTTGNPTDKEPKLSDLDVTRRNPGWLCAQSYANRSRLFFPEKM